MAPFAVVLFLASSLVSIATGGGGGVAAVGPDASIRIIPTIISLPPSVTYLDRDSVAPTPLTCEVWPPNANLTILAALSHAQTISPTLLGLVSVPTNSLVIHHSLTNGSTSSSSAQALGFRGQQQRRRHSSSSSPLQAFNNIGAQISVTDTSEIWRMDSMDLHCKATTQFGTIVSAPFRLVPARLSDVSDVSGGGRHHPMPSGYTNTRVREFIKGNVAFVSCHIPPDSQPPPLVQFYVNNSLVGNDAKYKQVHRPNEDQVFLLISTFDVSDEGDYRCSLTNPVTSKIIWAPETVRLQIRIPDRPVPLRVLLPIGMQDNSSQTASRQISVREGDNVTLFCVMEAAPPPEVRTFPHTTEIKRYKIDEKFGLLEIVNVQPADAALFLCSATHIGITITLKVKARLRLTQSPRDIRIPSLGSRAEFHCSSSDRTVTPLWLFNGNPIYTATPEVLVIDAVEEKDLGVYQCIARSLMPDGRTDEWVSASGVLSLQSDLLIASAGDLLPLTPSTDAYLEEDKPSTPEMTPRVEMALDNFAVYMTWNLSDETLARGHPDRATSYNLLDEHSPYGQADSLRVGGTSPRGTDSTGSASPVFLIEYANLERDSFLNPALVGLLPPEPATWSETARIDKMWKQKYGFVIGEPLRPGRTYRFRIRALSPDSGSDLIPPSAWSKPVNTHHISDAPPPRITAIQPYHDGRFNVTWVYEGDGSHSQGGSNTLPYKPFLPDFFLILVRPVVRGGAEEEETQKDSNNAVPKTTSPRYGRYKATRVNGSDAREGFVYNLNASIDYQLVVYGVRYEGTARHITLFSDAKIATLPEVPGFGSFSVIRVISENRPIFIGLGVLACILFLIILVTVIVCIVRQRNSSNHRNRLFKHNGYKMSANGQHGVAAAGGATVDDLGASSSPSAKALQANQTTAMMMGTLMRQSNFSEADAQRLQQQQQQQQQAAAAAAAMNLGVAYGYGYGYGAQMIPPPLHHHQSHHSLLLSPTAASSGGGGVSPAVYHSGTLPGGPAALARYGAALRGGGGGGGTLMGQVPPPPPFGSQQQLLSPDQTDQSQISLMRDFYQQQQQQPQQQQQFYKQTLLAQQPFMYSSTGNPNAIYLTGQQQQQLAGGETLSSRRQSQGYPYGGGSSIHSGTSLKPDCLADGSMHDEATLLARNPMSPLAQMPPHEMAVSPTFGMAPPPPPGYYQPTGGGSQQALHLMQGVGYHHHLSPSQQLSMYQQHQQAMMMSPGGGVTFFPGGQGGMPDPSSLMRHHSLSHHTDGESVYSYFSQQDVCHPQAHGHLNPLPEENHMNPVYTQSANQMMGVGPTTTGLATAGTNGHKHHHRRRRRKQHQQQQQQQQQQHEEEDEELEDLPQQLGSGEGAELPGGGNGFQFDDAQLERQQQQQQYHGYDESIMLCGERDQEGVRYGDMNGRGANANRTAPSAAAGLEQVSGGGGGGSGGGAEGNTRFDHVRSGSQSFDRSTPSYGVSPPVGVRSSSGALPPPSQPPPPPPAPQMGSGYFQTGGAAGAPALPMMMMMSSGAVGAAAAADSLSRRGGGGGGGAGGASGLLVGPPPRIRDYSEYGIPTGVPTNQAVGSPEATASAPKSSNKMAAAMMTMNTAATNDNHHHHQQHHQVYNGNNNNNNNGTQSTPLVGVRYREGQA